MKIAYLFLVNQNNGGVYQYSLSLLNSLTLNKSVSEITVYTRDKSFEFPGVKIKIINSYDFLFFISLFSSVFHMFPPRPIPTHTRPHGGDGGGGPLRFGRPQAPRRRRWPIAVRAAPGPTAAAVAHFGSGGSRPLATSVPWPQARTFSISRSVNRNGRNKLAVLVDPVVLPPQSEARGRYLCDASKGHAPMQLVDYRHEIKFLKYI
jgi:hypothetical protein